MLWLRRYRSLSEEDFLDGNREVVCAELGAALVAAEPDLCGGGHRAYGPVVIVGTEHVAIAYMNLRSIFIGEAASAEGQPPKWISYPSRLSRDEEFVGFLLFRCDGHRVGVLAIKGSNPHVASLGSLTRDPGSGFSLRFDSELRLREFEGIKDVACASDGHLVMAALEFSDDPNVEHAHLVVASDPPQGGEKRLRFDTDFGISYYAHLRSDRRSEALQALFNDPRVIASGRSTTVFWVGEGPQRSKVVCMRTLSDAETLGPTVVLHTNREQIVSLTATAFRDGLAVVSWMDQEDSRWRLRVALVDPDRAPHTVSQVAVPGSIEMPYWPGYRSGIAAVGDTLLVPFVGRQDSKDGIWIVSIRVER